MSKIEEINHEEVGHYLRSNKSVIIPLGSIENHGPALPLGTDWFIAEAFAQEIAKRLGILTAPTIRPGLSIFPHMAFKGTISLKPKTLIDVITDYVECLYAHGFRNFVFFSCHGSNKGPIDSAIQSLSGYLKESRFLMLGHYWEDIRKFPELNTFKYQGHCSGVEASVLLFLKKELVDLEKFRSLGKNDYISSENAVLSLDQVKKKITKNGMIGSDPSETDEELGKKIFYHFVEDYSKIIKGRLERL